MLRSVKYGLYGAVIAGLVGAPVIWATVDKSVTLVVDGRASTVSTTASRVGDVLADRDMTVGDHDLVAPAATSSVTDGMQVVLRRGRLLHLSVDGRSASVWTTASTVDEALAQLGYSTQDFVSVSRSQRLALRPTDIAIRTPRTMTVVHDGEREQISTTEATVGQALAQIDVVPDADDKLSVSSSTATADGLTIVLQRVTTRKITQAQQLAYQVTRRKDASLYKGTTRIVTAGRDGKARITYAVVYVDGKATARTQVASVVLAAPRTQVESIGTKSRPLAPVAATPDPGSAKAIAANLLAGYGWGSDQYDCLVSIWNHESGWRVNAANPSGAYGIPQALPGSKMASAGADWQTNPATQIKWGLGYIRARYNSPCGAWSFWQAHNYY